MVSIVVSENSTKGLRLRVEVVSGRGSELF